MAIVNSLSCEYLGIGTNSAYALDSSIPNSISKIREQAVK